jgi:hypothetical protein
MVFIIWIFCGYCNSLNESEVYFLGEVSVVFIVFQLKWKGFKTDDNGKRKWMWLHFNINLV